MHTPTPWHVGMKPGPFIYGPQGEQIADLTGALSFNAGPNAQFIIRACNSHAQLVESLQAIINQADAQFRAGDRHATFNRQTIDAIRAALNAAQERSR